MKNDIEIRNIPNKLLNKLKEEAKENNITINELIKNILEQYRYNSKEKNGINELCNLIELLNEIINENTFYLEQIIQEREKTN